MNTYLKGQNKIVCIVGKSGSGKSTITRKLRQMGLAELISYTTRPKRYENENTHIFVGKGFFNLVMQQEGCVAYTMFDEHYYGATAAQFVASDVYVIDPSGVQTLSQEVGRNSLKVFYIEVKWYKRLYRMIKERGIKSAFKRLIHDRKAFYKVDYDFKVTNNHYKDIGEICNSVVKWIKIWE